MVDNFLRLRVSAVIDLIMAYASTLSSKYPDLTGCFYFVPLLYIMYQTG